jgi:hypothetical protein
MKSVFNRHNLTSQCLRQQAPHVIARNSCCEEPGGIRSRKKIRFYSTGSGVCGSTKGRKKNIQHAHSLSECATKHLPSRLPEKLRTCYFKTSVDRLNPCVFQRIPFPTRKTSTGTRYWTNGIGQMVYRYFDGDTLPDTFQFTPLAGRQCHGCYSRCAAVAGWARRTLCSGDTRPTSLATGCINWCPRPGKPRYPCRQCRLQKGSSQRVRCLTFRQWRQRAVASTTSRWRLAIQSSTSLILLLSI